MRLDCDVDWGQRRAVVEVARATVAPKWTPEALRPASSLGSVWTLEDEPPVDPESRELAVTLAAGGPR